jgi:EAL domain-containing protein (putative c-di-GMP-specific phosphodiesterase class I)/GGDEF domain-containing protein
MISLYNLVLFYGLKERIFLIYIGYILSALTMMSIVQGFGHYLFPSWLYQYLRLNVISLNYLVLTFAVLFALFFLNYHKQRTLIYRRCLYYVYLLFSLSAFSTLLSESIAAPIFFVAMSIAYPLCFFLLYKNYNSENSGSALYIVSWIPLLIGGAIQPLELTDVIPYSFVVRNIFGVCIVFEITLMAMALSERVRQQKEISLYNATHDLETGLPNYQILEERIEHQIQAQIPTTLCLISVTGLNRLSPYLSEQQSATLMEHFLHSTRGYVQPNNEFIKLVPESHKTIKIARVRDNVFAVLLRENESHQVVVEKLEPLSNCVNALLEMSGVSVNLKTSIGFYRINGQHLAASAVLKKTFQALETAIRDGLAISGYDEQRHYSLTLASELREALSKDELMLYHQPQINPLTATVHGSEGLLRWKHKEHGFIPVDALISLAEDTGLINHVSLWVIDRACQDIRHMMGLGFEEHQVSVNISGLDVIDKKFLHNVQSILEKWQVPPKLLNLELTESVMISDYSSVKHVLEGLSTMGISVSIDDFGTGYSSLSHILELPFNELKIDRVFVTEMDTNQRHLDIVKTTIEMARILDLRVVAEGIETQAVAQELVACHCDLAQGYYYSKPLQFDAYLQWLKRNSPTLS